MALTTFKANSVCEMCGAEFPRLQYVGEKTYSMGYRVMEHMQCICKRCGYRWAMETKKQSSGETSPGKSND